MRATASTQFRLKLSVSSAGTEMLSNEKFRRLIELSFVGLDIIRTKTSGVGSNRIDAGLNSINYPPTVPN